MRHLSIFIFILKCVFVQAQMISNPGFEIGLGGNINSSDKQPINVKNDDTYLEGWFNPSIETSPNYLVYDGPKGANSIVRNNYAEIYPVGNAVAGLMVYNKQLKNVESYREYLSAKLLEPMQIGAKYNVRLLLANGYETNGAIYGKYGLKIGIYFSEDPPLQKSSKMLQKRPHAIVHEFVYTSDWKSIELSIPPVKKAYNYVTIGYFGEDFSEDDPNISDKSYVAENGKFLLSKHCYYFIDNFSITRDLKEIKEKVIAVIESQKEKYNNKHSIELNPNNEFQRSSIQFQSIESSINEDSVNINKYIDEIIDLKEIQLNKVSDCKVFFDTDKTTLKSISLRSLDSIATILKYYQKQPNYHFIINGHTSQTVVKRKSNLIRKSKENFLLSKNRANVVATHLINQGVSKDKIKVQGFGDAILKNPTKPSDKANRRVEIIIAENHKNIELEGRFYSVKINGDQAIFTDKKDLSEIKTNISKFEITDLYLLLNTELNERQLNLLERYTDKISLIMQVKSESIEIGIIDPLVENAFDEYCKKLTKYFQNKGFEKNQIKFHNLKLSTNKQKLIVKFN